MQTTSKHYNIIVDFAKFLRENGHKLFEKDTKLCLNIEQILVLQEYLIEANNTNLNNKDSKKSANKNAVTTQSSKEYLLLCKSQYLYLIQDFLFKVTNVKITGQNQPHNTIKLNIFGSLTYLEIKNCQVNNIVGIQNLRTQLEVLVCIKSINRVQDVLHFCGADQSSPLLWPKLHTLNLSYNQISFLDNSFRLTPSLELLDLSHNCINECSGSLRNLQKLKKLDLSFNRLESLPELNESNNQFEFLDISHNNIDKLDVRKLLLMNKLTSLNLSFNLIIDIKELYSLRNLTNLNQLKINNNPITHNILCDVLVDEILILNKKDRLSKTNPKASPQSKLLNQQTKSKFFRHPAISTPTSNYANQAKIAASYDYSNLNETYNKKSKQKRNLKFRRVSSIRKVDLESDEILSDSENTDKETPSTARLTIPQASSLSANYGTSPVNSDYDSDRLQKELENLKKSRKLYGAQWLLSSPNLLAAPSEEAEKKIEKQNVETLKDVIDRNHEDKANDINSANIIESFAVNKITSTFINISESKTCFLAISDKYLIEKDETNSDMIDFYEFMHFIDGKIYKEGLELHMDFEKDFEKINCIYQFENEIELHNFVDCLYKVLLNEFNFDKCLMYLCNKCSYMDRKPILNQTNDLICDNCKEFILKDNKLQIDSKADNENEIVKPRLASIRLNKSPLSLDDSNLSSSFRVKFNLKNESSDESEISKSLTKTQALNIKERKNTIDLNDDNDLSFLSKSFTLKDVLRTFQTQEEEIVEENEASKQNINEQVVEEQNQNENQSFVENSIFDEFNDVKQQSFEQTIENEEAIEEKVDENNKEEATESVSKEELSIEEILKNSQISRNDIDSIIKESYKIDNNLKLYFLMNVLNQNSSNDNDDEKLISTFKMKLFLLNEPELVLINSLCVISNKNIFIYRIKDKTLFEQNSEFDKCLKQEYTIPINSIEIIEISSGQHYLSIYTNDEQIIVKLVSFDVYEVQAFSSVLLKIINESDDCTSLRQIRKKNQQTDQNLLSILKQNPNDTIDLYIFISYNPTDEPYTTDYRINALFVHNDETLVFIEENLSYNQLNKQTPIKQFKLVNTYKINDIGNIRLFKDCDTKIEINFVDEANNSKQISILFYVNKQFILSQLINKLKALWEKIFFVDLPISY